MKYRQCLFAILLLLIAPVFHFPISAQANPPKKIDKRVVPAGQEKLIEAVFTPENAVLPEGKTLDKITIFGHYISLEFHAPAKNTRIKVFLKDDAEGHCKDAGRLSLCTGLERWPNWLEAYRLWLKNPTRNEKAESVWAKVEFKRGEGWENEPRNFVERVYGSLFHLPMALFAWVFFSLMALILLARLVLFSKTSEPLTIYLKTMAITALMGLGLLFLWASNKIEFTSLHFIAFAVIVSGAIFYAAKRETHALLLRALYKLFYTSGFLWVLFILILFYLLKDIPSLFAVIIENKVFYSLFQILLETPFVYSVYLALLMSLIILLLFKQGKGANLKPSWRWVLPAFAIISAIVGGLAVGVMRFENNLPIVAPNMVWAELTPVLQYMQGEMLTNNHLAGIDALTGFIFQLFGVSATSFTWVAVAYTCFASLGLALAARSIFNSWLAALAMGFLFPLWPTMPALALKGWWFFLFLGFAGIALASAIESARHGRRSLFWLAVLFAQLALEVRTEGIVVFCMIYVIEAFYRFPNLKPLKWVSLLLSFNLIRIMMLTILSAMNYPLRDVLFFNLEGYTIFFSHAFLLIPWVILFLNQRANRALFLCVIWFLGVMFFYLISPTLPSNMEFFVAFSPLYLIISGIVVAKPNTGLRMRMVRVLLLFMVAVAILHAFENKEVNATNERKEIVKLHQCLQEILPQIDENEFILFEPAFLSLMRPEQAPLSHDGRIPSPKRLKRIIKRKGGAICFAAQSEDKGMCCYFELVFDNESKYKQENCWHYSDLGLFGEEERHDCGIRVIRLWPKPEDD